MRDLGRLGLRGPLFEEVARPDLLALDGFTRYVGEDYAGAREAFLAAERCAPSAYHQYMLACVAASTREVEALLSHARAAIRGDPAYRERFRGDEEFVPYRGDVAFAAVVELTEGAER